MLTPPRKLPADLLRTVIERSWNLDTTGLGYLPVGFGSHHWKIGDEWFVVREVHRSPVCQARLDTFHIPGRDAALAFTPGEGPFGARAADLLAGRAEVLRARFGRYDALVRDALKLRDRMVLTHGEPHPGNTMRTRDGRRLIDRDTALISHPERDLWLLDETEGALPWPLDLYRLRWRLNDVAVEALRFTLPHAGGDDDAFGWTILRDTVNDL